MLETLLQIGKTLRLDKSDRKRFRHLDYIIPVPKPTDKTNVIYYSIPVVNGEINFEAKTEIASEYIKNALYTLKYKTSKGDSLAKYIWGDIYYGEFRKSGGKPDVKGNYRLGDANVAAKNFSESSFHRAQGDAIGINELLIKRLKEESIQDGKHETLFSGFRKSFLENIESIEKLLQDEGRQQYVFLHFAFEDKDSEEKHWYEFEPEMAAISEKMLDDILKEYPGGKLAFTKSFHKTLRGDVALAPDFNESNYYKNKTFNNREEVMDLMYALKFAEKPIIAPEGKIKIIVLPRGDNLTAENINTFFAPSTDELEDVSLKESEVDKRNRRAKGDEERKSLTALILKRSDPNVVTQFDFIFSKVGSNRDVDMIELAGIERSQLASLSERVQDIRQDVFGKRERLFSKVPKDYVSLKILPAFKRVFGCYSALQPEKYQSHLLKILPQIYSGTYYNDKFLLPALIETVEYKIRNRKPEEKIQPFNLLKFDYEFLVQLRNTKGGDWVNKGDSSMKKMKDGNNYKAGKLLGEMAKPLNKRIGSFEKSVLGNLRRHITDRGGLLDLANMINEKLCIHGFYENKGYLKKLFVEFSEEFHQIDEGKYDRNECAYGIFEGYFSFSKPEASNSNDQAPTDSEEPSNINNQNEESERDGDK